MPEGPSIVIVRELVQELIGRTVREVSGNVKTIDPSVLTGRTITGFKSWGKHFLILFDDVLTVRIHFLMFGTYRINERKESPPRLSLVFDDDQELNFYTCSVQLIEQPLEEVYDFTADVMHESWDAKAALKKLKAQPDTLACDALLDQNIFSGVGNIIKNEILYRIRVHPESRVGAMPPKKLKEMVAEAVQYSFDFLEWKKAFILRKQWLAYTKKTCPRCDLPLKKTYPGTTKRRAFFCDNCQILYT
jgi:endonuclease-8